MFGPAELYTNTFKPSTVMVSNRDQYLISYTNEVQDLLLSITVKRLNYQISIRCPLKSPKSLRAKPPLLHIPHLTQSLGTVPQLALAGMLLPLYYRRRRMSNFVAVWLQTLLVLPSPA